MTYYFAQNATVEVREPGTARFKVVGAAQEVSIDTEFEVEELYQFGSILRTTAARHHASINVKVSTAQFGSFADDAAWFWKVLNAAGVEDIPESGTQFAGGKRVTISDTTNLPMFSIAGEWVSDDGSETIYGRVDGVYFKNFSWGGALGEYIIEELEGTGSQVTFTNKKAYAAGGDENLWSNVAQRITTGGIEAVMGSGTTVTTPAQGLKLVVPIDNYTEYSKVVVTVLDMPKYTDGSTETDAIYTDSLTHEVPVTPPGEGQTQATITVIHKKPTDSSSSNPACTCVINIVADGLSKQVPVEFTTAISGGE